MDFEPKLIIEFLSGLILAALLLALAHWFPAGHGERGQLPASIPALLARYIIGTALLWIGKTVWLLLIGHGWIALGLLVIDVAGGLTVMTAYGWDRLFTALRQARMAKATDDELRPER